MGVKLLIDEAFVTGASWNTLQGSIATNDNIASVTWRVAHLVNSRAAPFPIRAALYSGQLCRENLVNADWPIFVYATKWQCAAVRHGISHGVTNYHIGPPWYIMRHLETCHSNTNTSKEASELSRLPITAPPS